MNTKKIFAGNSKPKRKNNKNTTNINGTIFKQLNLQKKKVATTTFMKELMNNEIGMIQEPYFTKGNKLPTTQNHTVYIGNPSAKTTHRAAVLLPNELATNSILLNGLSDNDTVAVKCTIAANYDILVVSMYMDIKHNVKSANNILQSINKYAKKHNIRLLLCIDSNSHNTAWGSKDNNNRGETLLEIIQSENFLIENIGNKPTFENARCDSVIDLTLTNDKLNKEIESWEVMNNSLSDHNLIRITILMKNKYTTSYKDYKNTDWNKFGTVLNKLLEEKPLQLFPLSNQQKLDNFCNTLTKYIVEATEKSTPTKTSNRKTNIPWWTHHLTAEKQKTVKLKKKWKKDKTNDNLHNEYKDQENKFKNLIDKEKEESWKNHCTNMEKLPRVAKLAKSLKGNKYYKLNSLKNNGSHTETMKDTLTVLADTLLGQEKPNDTNKKPMTGTQKDTNLINKIIKKDRLNRIVQDLNKNKTPGPDNIRNESIQKGWDYIGEHVQHLLKHSLELGTTPNPWNASKGIIIPKQGKDSYDEPRSFRIICLTSNLLKLLEKAVLNYMTEDMLIDKRLTKNQFGFRKGSSTEAAIHKLTRKIEDAICGGNMSLGIFLDIEGAFDNISHQSMKRALYELNIPNTIVEWIINMISSRTITLKEKGVSITRLLYKGCPQGGVLSPFLWNITMNMLLSDKELYQDDINAFADDMVIQINGIDSTTMRDVAIKYLKKINNWCANNGIKLSVLKTKAIMFTTLNKKFKFKPIKLGDHTINLETDVKYLGITLDRYLKWNTHIQNKCNQANKLLGACKQIVSKTWGLSPDKTRWIYNQMILPNITYSCFAWAHKVSLNPKDRTNNILKNLQQIQRKAALLITGAMYNTPTATLEVMAGTKPIHLVIKSKSIQTAIKLQLNTKWVGNPPPPSESKNKSHGTYLEQLINKIGDMAFPPTTDYTHNTIMPQKHYYINDDTYTQKDINLISKKHILIFTDGSKLTIAPQSSGAGIFITSYNRDLHEASIPLGTYSTIFQCEMFAIKYAAEWIINNNIKINNIIILTDSKSSMDALNKHTSESKLVLETAVLLNLACQQNSIFITKVKSHTGIPGNDRADMLAKKATSYSLHGPEPHIGYTFKQLNDQIHKKDNQDHIMILSKTKISDKGKLPAINILLNNGYNIVTNNRKELRNLTNIITGHNNLQYYQFIMGKSNSPLCQHCNLANETSEHFLAKCQAFSLQRQQTFGIHTSNINHITKNCSTKSIIKFIKITKGLND